MEKDEKNIENIKELTDFEETSADITTESMFSDEIAQDEAIEEDSSLFNQEDEISEETQKEAEKDTEEENKEIEEEIEENTSFLAQNNDITEITEQEPTTIIEEYKPQESYVSTVDDFEEEIETNKMITVRPVKFQEFEQAPPSRSIKKNLDILQDVSMHISVELGRTKSSIKEVMEMEQGSIVELDKIAGEQVEIFVNEKLVAKGEVIVIEDKFGVRVTSTSIAKSIT
ncbi:MAG: flagellar motor switch protein FliN [Candidatus Gastranaerophilales bacterium]|nr:flagellar motor switch protein FliN [Candidatus Gastranaerophilales bacterium]